MMAIREREDVLCVIVGQQRSKLVYAVVDVVSPTSLDWIQHIDTIRHNNDKN